jgi:hypothetical protein
MSEPKTQERRRSPRVLLQVPLILSTDVEGGPQIQGQALTLVVNAYGGLLETSLNLRPDQRLTLVNQDSGKMVACKVLRVEEEYEANYTVAFEFDHCNPQFWPADHLKKHQEAGE